MHVPLLSSHMEVELTSDGCKGVSQCWVVLKCSLDSLPNFQPGSHNGNQLAPLNK